MPEELQLHNTNHSEQMSRISLINQEGTLKSYFPEGKIKRNGEKELTWIGAVTPSPVSLTYTIKLHYKHNEGAKIYVVDPKPLVLAVGKYCLPHVYSTPEQQLCLYYPVEKEWTSEMYYVHSLIPWACEWLYHYELWVCTGTWHGGGVHHESEAEKQAIKLKEELIEVPKNDKKEIKHGN